MRRSSTACWTPAPAWNNACPGEVTVLMLAAALGLPELVARLLQAGADLQCPRRTGPDPAALRRAVWLHCPRTAAPGGVAGHLAAGGCRSATGSERGRVTPLLLLLGARAEPGTPRRKTSCWPVWSACWTKTCAWTCATRAASARCTWRPCTACCVRPRPAARRRRPRPARRAQPHPARSRVDARLSSTSPPNSPRPMPARRPCRWRGSCANSGSSNSGVGFSFASGSEPDPGSLVLPTAAACPRSVPAGLRRHPPRTAASGRAAHPAWSGSAPPRRPRSVAAHPAASRRARGMAHAFIGLRRAARPARPAPHAHLQAGAEQLAEHLRAQVHQLPRMPPVARAGKHLRVRVQCGASGE